MDGLDQKSILFESEYDKYDTKFLELQEKITDPIIKEQLENIRAVCETFTICKLIEIERYLGINIEPLSLGQLRLVRSDDNLRPIK